LRARAKALGFDVCRVTAPDLSSETRQNLAQWLDEGRHGDMDWMA
jgi:epoxyqueuosine reductase